MNYTESDASVVHVGTGHRMHQSTAPVTTEVSAADMNMVIWSLMELLNSAGIPGATFDPGNPATFQRVLQAVQYLAGPGNPSTIKSLPDVGVLAGASAVANGAALTAALSSRRSRLLVPEGEFQVPSDLSNVFGAELAPGGKITKPVAGGRQQLNVSADIGQHVFGQEYLWAFHEAIRGQFGGESCTIVFSGDSTTFGAGGNGASSPFLINEIVEILGREAGFKVTCVNRGQPGQTTAHWRTTHLAGDMAAAPKLLVLRWGINDPGWLKTGVTPPLDAGQAYPGRRDIGDFQADLRAGLAAIRAMPAGALGTLSILLMTPNSTSDTPNGRDEAWYEQVRGVVRQAARDFKCAFIDTYSLWHDSRVAAGLWMDDPMPGGGRAIHPHNTMNSWIATRVADLIFPRGLRPSFLSSAYGTQGATAKPNDFKVGVNLARCLAGDGFPGGLDGAVLTVRTPDDVAMQIAWDFEVKAISRMPAVRFGANGVWHEWLSRTHADLASQNGWVAASADATLRLSKSWKVVTLSGQLKDGATAVGTVVTSLPAGSRPFATQRFVVPCGASFDQAAFVQIRADGDVAIQTCPSNGGLSLDGLSFEAWR